jgi:arylsulfatase
MGWAHALDSPFQCTKQIARNFGGTRNGMVISLPAHTKEQGEIRSQWHHVIDIPPTVLDVSPCPATGRDERRQATSG